MTFRRSIAALIALALMVGCFAVGFLKGNRDALERAWRMDLWIHLSDLRDVDAGKIDQFRSKKKQYIIGGYRWFSQPRSWAEYYRARPDHLSARTTQSNMDRAKQVVDAIPEDFPSPSTDTLQTPSPSEKKP